jgi:hypothetical protein
MAASVALAGLTALAFALRVPGLDQTLYGDEYFTYGIVTANDLGGVWHAVYHTSITPPLHYFLAWLALKLGGDDTVLVRVPSLILGTAIVPLVFVLARRIGGVRAGLLAALVMAFGPFAIWYSDEARAYATMMFLVALSALALLRALDGAGRRWWVIYVLAACAALWSHYTAVFVVVAQAAWALWTHRELRRQLLIAQGATAVGYLPWLPGFLEQRRNDVGIEVIGAFAQLSVQRVFEVPLQTLAGHPFVPLRDSPGPKGVILVLLLVALVLAVGVRRPAALRALLPKLRSEPGLVLLLVLATPLGLILYDAIASSLYIPRNLSASLPAFAVLVGVLLDRLAAALPARLAAPALAALFAVLAVSAVESVVDDDLRRPPYREAAQYLDEVAGSADPVIDAPLTPATSARTRRTTLDLYFARKHPLYPSGAGSSTAWRALSAGRNVYLVAPKALVDRPYGGAPPPHQVERLKRLGGPDGRAVLRDESVLPGIFPVSILRYSGLVDGRLERTGTGEAIEWSLGSRVRVAPGVARGQVEELTPPPRPFSVSGWAIDAARESPADWVLLFSRGRLLGASAAGIPRPDIAGRHGESARLSGFRLVPAEAPRDRSAVRVFAVVGDRASELPQR